MPKNGRPRTHCNIKALVLRLAKGNPAWGYRPIHRRACGIINGYRKAA
jgi:hypothetical protein